MEGVEGLYLAAFNRLVAGSIGCERKFLFFVLFCFVLFDLIFLSSGS